MKIIARIVFAAALLCTVAGTAAAKEVGGQLGIGAETTSSLSGMSARYWFSSNLGVQGILGLGYRGAVGPNESETNLGLGVRLLYIVAGPADTNAFVGGGFSLGLIDADTTNLDGLFGVEHFFSDNLSISAHAGLVLGLNDPFTMTFGPTSQFGAAFHFYFM